MKRCLCCLLPLVLLTGCQALPFDRELESTMLVQVLGVDWVGEQVTLTAVAAPTEDGKEPILSASGADLDQAKTALKGSGEDYVALTHVTQLVVGEGTDLYALLEAALLEPETGQGATVWLVEEGSAQQLLTEAQGVAKRLSSIELNNGISPVTVLQGLMELEEMGETRLPTLALEEDVLTPGEPRQVKYQEEDGHGA